MKKIIRDFRNLFEHEDYYKSVSGRNFGATIMLNMKVMVTKIKPYQLKNILIKVDHT